jgi:hypothetical protein
MTPRNLPWSEGKWRTPPHSTQELNGHLLVEAAIGSDYWEKTSYGFQCTETRGAQGRLHALGSRWAHTDPDVDLHGDPPLPVAKPGY